MIRSRKSTMNKNPQNVYMAEIHGGLWQKIYAVAVFSILGGLSIATWLSYIFPRVFHATHWLGCHTLQEKILHLACPLIPLAVGFYLLLTTMKYRSYINSEVVGQTNGFRHSFVEWNRINHYTMERIPMRWESLIEPVLRDADGKILMKPMAPVVEHSSTGKEQRARFWRCITDRIDDRQQQ